MKTENDVIVMARVHCLNVEWRGVMATLDDDDNLRRPTAVPWQRQNKCDINDDDDDAKGKNGDKELVETKGIGIICDIVAEGESEDHDASNDCCEKGYNAEDGGVLHMARPNSYSP